jgi:hypothetical protein
VITIKEAAGLTGYSITHLARLIRTGKLAGKRIGPIWTTTVEALEVYRRTDPRPGPVPAAGRPHD